MMLSATELVRAILKNPTDLENVRALVTDDVTYVSLNYDNPELKRVMPWAGTGHGAERIVRTFVDVGRYWDIVSFDIEALFGADDSAAVFGRFTYRSKILGKIVTSPFAIFAKAADGKCSYLQFMEDSFATAASFRSGGSWIFRGDPQGPEVVV
jgi:uncharacterized protein